MVVDVLGPAVGKGNGVRSLDNTGAIVGLSGVEGSLGVVVGDGVGVGVGGDLIRVNLSSVGGATVGGGSVGNGVHNRGMDGVGNGVVDSVGDGVVHSMGHRVGHSVTKSVVGKTVVGQAVVGQTAVGQSHVAGGGEQLRGGRGRGHQGEDGDSLKEIKCRCLAVVLLVVVAAGEPYTCMLLVCWGGATSACVLVVGIFIVGTLRSLLSSAS